MTDYVCVDGPLAGQTIGSPDSYSRGTSVMIEVVDVGQHDDDTTLFEYIVESRPHECHPGHLRLAAAEGVPSTGIDDRQPAPA